MEQKRTKKKLNPTIILAILSILMSVSVSAYTILSKLDMNRYVLQTRKKIRQKQDEQLRAFIRKTREEIRRNPDYHKLKLDEF